MNREGKGVPQFCEKAGTIGRKLIFGFFHTILALFGQLYGLFKPFLTLFDTKTSFLALLENLFPKA